MPQYVVLVVHGVLANVKSPAEIALALAAMIPWDESLFDSSLCPKMQILSQLDWAEVLQLPEP